MSGQCDEPTSKLFKLWRTTIDATNRIQIRLEKLLKNSGGLSLGDYSVLLVLTRVREGHMRLGEVARELVFSPARVTYIVRSLERRGFVERQVSSEDGRIIFAHITPAGRAVFDTCHAAYCEHIEELCLACVSPEEAAVMQRVFSRITERLGDL